MPAPISSRPMPVDARFAVDRVHHHHEAEEDEDRRRQRVAHRLERARGVRLARPQHEHRRDGDPGEQRNRERDVVAQRVEAAGQNQHGRPDGLPRDRKPRGLVGRMNAGGGRKEDAVAGHREVDARAGERHRVHARDQADDRHDPHHVARAHRRSTVPRRRRARCPSPVTSSWIGITLRYRTLIRM